jgi:hypothetical protein
VSTDRDVERIVRSWLDEGVNVVPERVLDAVIGQLPATPQRRVSWLARRTPTLNTYARLGLVAAAVLAVVIVGIGLFGKSLNVGPAPSPTPSQSSSASASPAAADNPLVGTWLAPVVTCAQEIATIEAAGYTADQVTEAGFDPTCAHGNIGSAVRGTNQYSVVFDGLPAAAKILSLTTYDYGAFNSPHMYEVKDAATFLLGSHTSQAWEYCLTFSYAISGDQLTIHRISPNCTGTGDASLNDQIALTAILETSPFTRQP